MNVYQTVRASVLGVLGVLAASSVPASAQCVAQWDTTLGDPSGQITATITHDDGSGPALYAGYSGLTMGGNVAMGVAKLVNGQWVNVGEGVRADRGFLTPRNYIGEAFDHPNTQTMFEYDTDGAGPMRPILLVGITRNFGAFDPENSCIATWDGNAWSTMSPGLEGEGPFYPPIARSFAVYNSDLYCAGEFLVQAYELDGTATGEFFFGVARWNASQQRWEAVGNMGLAPTDLSDPEFNLADGNVLVVHNDGTGSALYLGGQFGGIYDGAETVPGTSNIARWDGEAWSSVGGGVGGGQAEQLTFMGTHLGALYVGGISVQSWSGSAWTNHGEPPLNTESSSITGFKKVLSGAVYNDGSGPAIFFAGATLFQGGVLEPNGATKLVKFQNGAFTTVGDRVFGQCDSSQAAPDGTEFCPGRITHLSVQPIGGQNRLIVGGPFMGADSAPVFGNLMWDGTSLKPLLAQGSFGGVPSQLWKQSSQVIQTASIDLDGSGPGIAKLLVLRGFFAGGRHGGPLGAGELLVRDGDSWTHLADLPFESSSTSQPGGLFLQGVNVVVEPRAAGDRVYLAVSYALGSIGIEGSVVRGEVFRLDGTSWTKLGASFENSGSTNVDFLVFGGMVGSDFQLFASGRFRSFDSQGTPTIVLLFSRWDGSAWQTVPGPTLADYAVSMAIGDDGTGTAAYFASGFGTISGNRVIKWNGTTTSVVETGLPPNLQFDQSGNPVNSYPALIVFQNKVHAWMNGGFDPVIGFEGFVDGKLFVLNNGVWNLVGSPISGYVGSELLGVAMTNSGEKMYFETSRLYNNEPDAFVPYLESMNGIVEFDGESFTTNTAFGRFVADSPHITAFGRLSQFNAGGGYVTSVPEADGSRSIWFIGPLMSGVGAPVPTSPVGALVGISSGGLARWGCPAAPACRPDFNGSGSVTVQDIFDFLAAWFAGTPAADFNTSGAVTVQDIFDFLAGWFAGC